MRSQNDPSAKRKYKTIRKTILSQNPEDVVRVSNFNSSTASQSLAQHIGQEESDVGYAYQEKETYDFN